MNYLKLIALFLGAIGILGGIWGLLRPGIVQRFLREFPRNEIIGRIFIFIDMVATLYLLHHQDLGSWNWIKGAVYWLSPLIYFYIIFYVKDYLGARGLAWFLVLVAKPVLWVCFMRDEPARLVVTTLAYMWIIIGLCTAAAPHWLRDGIAFWQVSSKRWISGCWAKIGLSTALLVLGIFFY
jgi:hypothetical protein